MHKNQMHITAFFLMIIVLILLIRLFFIQIVNYKTFKELAVSQREVPGFAKNQRGNIYDRNMIPITNRTDESLLLIEPHKVKDTKNLLNLIDRNSAESKANVLNLIQNRDLFLISVSDTKSFANMQGVYPVKIPKRYEDNSPFSQVVGYANSDNKGICGVEKAMDDILRGKTQMKAVKIADSKSNQIQGIGLKMTGFDEKINSVKLTLDYRIQKAVFDATEKMEKGAAIVVDVQSGDILGLVSRPNFNQNEVEKFIGSNHGELTNRALMEYNAGSVFKIVVASAAIEQSPRVLTKTFHCNGFIDVMGRKVLCHKNDGHGDETVFQAFANSCNPAFIEIGKMIEKKSIIDMAQKFGFGVKTDILPNCGEQDGVVSKVENNYPLDCANLSIGQGDLMVTPLQIVSMANTIANGGIVKKLNLLDSIVDDKGDVVQTLKKQQNQRIISSFTANQVAQMMRETVLNGTGKSAESEAVGGACGKTGSAQTGWVVNGSTLVHGWFAGYFPYQSPKYAVAVFVEGGDSGSTSAAPIFKEIADRIAQIPGYLG